jgi:biopolymer transport protein ExbD
VTIQVGKTGLVVHRDKDIAVTQDTLEAAMRDLGKTCTSPVEVQASDDVSYQDIIRAMDTSVKTGFVDISLGTPGAAAAAPQASPPPAAKPSPDMHMTIGADGKAVIDISAPRATSALATAPVVIITKTEISIGATKIAFDAGDLSRQIADAIKAMNPPAGSAVILQADAATPGKVINEVVAATKLAGYDDLLFAVKNR